MKKVYKTNYICKFFVLCCKIYFDIINNSSNKTGRKYEKQAGEDNWLEKGRRMKNPIWQRQSAKDNLGHIFELLIKS